MKETIIENTICYIKELFKNNSDGHDSAQSLRVYHNAIMIADTEPGCDRMVIALASLLHDADDYKLFDTENNANAWAFLRNQQVDDDIIGRICRTINAVSFSKNKDKPPANIEEMIVRDADRLDAIGAIGIARTFAYGGKTGRTIEDSISHFHDKLLLLKDMMHTNKAKEIAEERHRYMLGFLDELEKDIKI